jgi:hypothetical protein
MEKIKTCQTCACRGICKYENNDKKDCEIWIDKEDLRLIRDRKQFVPSLLRMQCAYENNDENQAKEIVSAELDRAIGDLHRYLQSHYICDWPFLLAAMRMYSEMKTEELPEELKELTSFIRNSTGLITIELPTHA